MKRILTVSLLLLVPALAQAEVPVSAEEFLSQYPEQPMDACGVGSTSPQGEFIEKVTELEGNVQKEIVRRQKGINKADPTKKMMAAAVDVPGFEDIE